MDPAREHPMGISDLTFLGTGLRCILIGAYVAVTTPLLMISIFGSLVAVASLVSVPARLITGVF
jgi:hypothetical protein